LRFLELREVRILHTGAMGSVKSVDEIKLFDSDQTLASDGSLAFFREIDALLLVVHPCVVRIVGYCLVAQIETDFAAGDALPRLDDTVKVIVVVEVELIHSRRVVRRDLKLADIMFDERGHPMIVTSGAVACPT
jgi:serine/threonine protein kinase